MLLPFKEQLKAKAKQSRFIAGCYLALSFIGGALDHALFSHFNEWLWNHAHWLAIPLGWVSDHFLVFISLSGGSYCFVIVAWATLSGRIRPAIEIVSLQEGDTVSHRQMVYGLVKGRNPDVQVLVLAGSRWYPQWKPTLKDGNWRAQCQFGTYGSQPGERFNIVAISGATKGNEPLSALPVGAKQSRILSVSRSAERALPIESGMYLSGDRKSITEPWASYTSQSGKVEYERDTVVFEGTFDHGWRYPPSDVQYLSQARILGLRFMARGELNFYAHFRGSLVLYITSRFTDWGIPEGENEFRVPLATAPLSGKWQVVFIYLPSLEQKAKKRLDVVQRFSIRGNLSLSHVWCLQKIDELPREFLSEAVTLDPPI